VLSIVIGLVAGSTAQPLVDVGVACLATVHFFSAKW